MILRKPIPSTPYRPITDAPGYELVIALGGVTITGHQALSEEIVLAREIVELVDGLERRKKERVVDFLSHKLQV